MSTTIPAQQVTRLFTFGYGHLCPYTGEELGDHYALVTAPDASSARTFMNTAFKRNWAFEYDGVTDRRIADYVPGMKLHLQVVLLPNADPTGLAYTRADDDAEDPTPTGPREPLHTGGMTEGGLVDETEAQCPPECAQNWVRASDPLKHVDHCPKINETRTTLDNGCPEHGYRVTAGCSRCKQPVDKTPAEPVTVYKPAPASHPDWAKHVYGCGGGRQCRCDIAAGNAEPVDETGGYWDPSVTSVPVAEAFSREAPAFDEDCWHGNTCPGTGPDCGRA